MFSAPSDVHPPAGRLPVPSGCQPRPAPGGPSRLLPVTDPTLEPWCHKHSGGLITRAQNWRAEGAVKRRKTEIKGASLCFWKSCVLQDELWDEPVCPCLRFLPHVHSCTSSPGTSLWTEQSRSAQWCSRATPSWDVPHPSWGHNQRLFFFFFTIQLYWLCSNINLPLYCMYIFSHYGAFWGWKFKYMAIYTTWPKVCGHVFFLASVCHTYKSLHNRYS